MAELLGRLLVAAHPEGGGVELLLTAGLVAVLLAAVAVLRGLGREAGAEARSQVGAGRFAALRARLRASDPDAAGHRRARAPGTTG